MYTVFDKSIISTLSVDTTSSYWTKVKTKAQRRLLSDQMVGPIIASDQWKACGGHGEQ